MGWCLECHRNPEKFLRPKEQVFTMGFTPAEDQETLGRRLKKQYAIRSEALLTTCSTCHR
jgi:hypothetical protein